MKVAILSESTADESAVRILCEAVLKQKIEPIGFPLRTRGWPAVLHVLPSIIKHLHYQTDAEGLVVVADSNHTPVFKPGGSDEESQQCRLSKLIVGTETVLSHLRPIPGRQAISVAVGLAVPAIEAWCLCGIDPNVSEAAWREGLAKNQEPYNKLHLKQKVYGRDRPSLELETRRATEEAHRLAKNIPFLEDKFPIGFGTLSQTLQNWS